VSHSGHRIEKCNHGTIVAQCRCASRDKTVIIVPCPERCDFAPVEKNVIDANHIDRQRAFSAATFGPGMRTKGVLDHIRKEMKEIEVSPSDLDEWVDVIILGIDGAWRAGHKPQEIIDAIVSKQTRNEARTWPDWRTAPEGQAIEHDRSRMTELCGYRWFSPVLGDQTCILELHDRTQFHRSGREFHS